MLSETDRERIRRAFHLEHKSIRQLAKEEGCSRDTIRGAISNDPLKPYQSTRKRPAPVFGPYQLRVEALLHQNERLPRKQRYTAHRIFEVLREEGYQGCESTVRHYISARKIASHTPDVFLPLEFEPGQDAQVDWGEATAIIAGHREKVQLFIMRLCFSRRTFAMTFPTQEQESFLWAHLQAFKHLGGVPHRISYDNLGTAVKLAFEKTGKAGRPRHEVRAFVAFRSHYLFESHFCTPGQGHEKGQVEHGVGYTRRNAMVPLPEAASFEDLNQKLLERCLQEDTRRVAREPETIGAAWEQERPLLLPLPPSDYECCEMKTVRLTPYSQATYNTNRYSVPTDRARRTVTLKAHPFQIEIWDDRQLLATHPRCYGHEQDIFDPLHYLSLLEQRPGAFDYAKPLKQWRAGWPPCYHQLLANLREKWPEGRGVQEFIRILQLHQHYDAALVEQAIGQALSYGCAHLDGVQYCLHQSIAAADPPEQVAAGRLDLTDRPDLDAIGNQPIDLSRYEQLLKLSW
jgi:transposase